MYYFGLLSGVYEKPAFPEMASNAPYLTFIHTSFEKIFCQNKVKKNCKLFSRKSLKNADFRCKETLRKHASYIL